MKPKIDFDNIQIATPCVADWDNMEGTDQVRHCTKCKKDVFNISEMTRRDAENLFLERVGKEQPCIRLYRRFDGSIIIDDCPMALRKLRDRIKQAHYAASLLISFLMSCAAASAQSEKLMPLNGLWESTKAQIKEPPQNYSAADGGGWAPYALNPQATVRCRVIGTNVKWKRQHSAATNAAVTCSINSSVNRQILRQSEQALLRLAQENDTNKQFVLAATSLNNAANCQWYQNKLNDAKETFAKAHKIAMQATPSERQHVIATISENMQLLEKRQSSSEDKNIGNASWLLTEIGGLVQTAR